MFHISLFRESYAKNAKQAKNFAKWPLVFLVSLSFRERAINRFVKNPTFNGWYHYAHLVAFYEDNMSTSP
jgi:hypothetical protein